MWNIGLIQDFIHLFFPRLCVACNRVLLSTEDIICIDCEYHLPFTDFDSDMRNDSARQLLGKLDFEFAISMFYLARSSRVESLLHQLKYKGDQEIGVFLGNMYANRLKKTNLLSSIDSIIPIPLHQSKLRKRGYNQSLLFAKGMAEVLGIEVNDQVLIRAVASESQTKKSRTERYENVERVFAMQNANYDFGGQHVLLVDDILTTGATICAAGNVLKEANARVSVATIARA